jgi:hypothetical protein
MIEGSDLLRVYIEVARIMRCGKSPSIDDIVAQLQSSGLFCIYL